jgi:hypothetical protein
MMRLPGMQLLILFRVCAEPAIIHLTASYREESMVFGVAMSFNKLIYFL